MATKKTSAASTQATSKAGGKRASARSDLGQPIGPWFDEQPPEKRPMLDMLRDLVDATVPQAESGLKWGVPFWTLGGAQLCDLVVLKHEVALGIFAPPAAFDDPDGQLSGASEQYRVLKVKHIDEIDAARVKRWLRAAVAAAG